MTASPGRPGLRVIRVPADRPVALDAHRVARGVQGLAADHDRVQVELVLLGRPAAVADPPVELEQLDRVDAAAPGHAVLAVGGEHHVVGAQRPRGPDLGGLLPEQRGPDAELALALQGDRLGVDPADQHQVPVQVPDVGGGEVQRIVGMVDPLTLRGKQLDECLVRWWRRWSRRRIRRSRATPFRAGTGITSTGQMALGSLDAYTAELSRTLRPGGAHASAFGVGRSSPDDICPDCPWRIRAADDRGSDAQAGDT